MIYKDYFRFHLQYKISNTFTMAPSNRNQNVYEKQFASSKSSRRKQQLITTINKSDVSSSESEEDEQEREELKKFKKKKLSLNTSNRMKQQFDIALSGSEDREGPTSSLPEFQPHTPAARQQIIAAPSSLKTTSTPKNHEPCPSAEILMDGIYPLPSLTPPLPPPSPPNHHFRSSSSSLSLLLPKTNLLFFLPKIAQSQAIGYRNASFAL
jgi:hypothetical protein